MFNLSSRPEAAASHIAALDLGSNSFHMIVARWDNGQLTLLDRLREPVRLGFGLQADGSLSKDARERALACLERFGECLRAYPSRSVRIVGTKTLRSVNDGGEFLAAAEARLGHPVEIISGDEEARLIYLGVAHCIAPDKGNRIVMDIGGGSTEVILGEGMTPSLKESLSMGCVAITKQFFHDGKVSEKSITKALIACLQELQPVKDEFIERGWQQVLGASGSIKAVAKVCEANGWSDGAITAVSLDKIIARYLDEGKLDIDMPGLSDDRKPVFLGGAIVLRALFEALQLKTMIAADWALREGLLFDQKGRLENHDIRQASVDALALRFHVNMEKATAVENTALQLLAQVAQTWQLTANDASKLLGWAARLYQVGLDIAHNDYHKHSAYIVQHVDLAGCSRAEQAQLSALVLAHRKRFPAKNFPLDNIDLVRLAILLRLAAIFHRGRIKDGLPVIALTAEGKKIKLSLPQQWLQNHPLTQADLETEQRHLGDVGYQLDVVSG
ncbi:exopolyphosphatase [Cellvibrio sp. BR]|uniref:Ppx/GppA phosphatase family protein n=1 Tax=Cellvibrio sp. BR TaxID=1134474 RepID=UPI00026017E0|nr:Ppx/GppA phosphatase family protein [Cellvibrio sp. BR]EIK46317.1 exopolyphosphatase [Cellvibrio sp. BR]